SFASLIAGHPGTEVGADYTIGIGNGGGAISDTFTVEDDRVFVSLEGGSIPHQDGGYQESENDRGESGDRDGRDEQNSRDGHDSRDGSDGRDSSEDRDENNNRDDRHEHKDVSDDANITYTLHVDARADAHIADNEYAKVRIHVNGTDAREDTFKYVSLKEGSSKSFTISVDEAHGKTFTVTLEDIGTARNPSGEGFSSLIAGHPGSESGADYIRGNVTGGGITDTFTVEDDRLTVSLQAHSGSNPVSDESDLTYTLHVTGNAGDDEGGSNHVYAKVEIKETGGGTTYQYVDVTTKGDKTFTVDTTELHGKEFTVNVVSLVDAPNSGGKVINDGDYRINDASRSDTFRVEDDRVTVSLTKHAGGAVSDDADLTYTIHVNGNPIGQEGIEHAYAKVAITQNGEGGGTTYKYVDIAGGGDKTFTIDTNESQHGKSFTVTIVDLVDKNSSEGKSLLDARDPSKPIATEVRGEHGDEHGEHEGGDGEDGSTKHTYKVSTEYLREAGEHEGGDHEDSHLYAKVRVTETRGEEGHRETSTHDRYIEVDKEKGTFTVENHGEGEHHSYRVEVLDLTDKDDGTGKSLIGSEITIDNAHASDTFTVEDDRLTVSLQAHSGSNPVSDESDLTYTLHVTGNAGDDEGGSNHVYAKVEIKETGGGTTYQYVDVTTKGDKTFTVDTTELHGKEFTVNVVSLVDAPNSGGKVINDGDYRINDASRSDTFRVEDDRVTVSLTKHAGGAVSDDADLTYTIHVNGNPIGQEGIEHAYAKVAITQNGEGGGTTYKYVDIAGGGDKTFTIDTNESQHGKSFTVTIVDLVDKNSSEGKSLLDARDPSKPIATEVRGEHGDEHGEHEGGDGEDGSTKHTYKVSTEYLREAGEHEGGDHEDSHLYAKVRVTETRGEEGHRETSTHDRYIEVDKEKGTFTVENHGEGEHHSYRVEVLDLTDKDDGTGKSLIGSEITIDNAHASDTFTVEDDRVTVSLQAPTHTGTVDDEASLTYTVNVAGTLPTDEGLGHVYAKVAITHDSVTEYKYVDITGSDKTFTVDANELHGANFSVSVVGLVDKAGDIHAAGEGNSLVSSELSINSTADTFTVEDDRVTVSLQAPTHTGTVDDEASLTYTVNVAGTLPTDEG
ncbi:hypothetical protein, partial [Polynucleobacter sp. MWH-Braz-FAM2G]|uniref:hypothetical protein n=1 Tax=Polynucleobacter sp. MWH-Braz-FAM2G TaxID=1855883 RepID=UPI00352FFDF6